MSANVELDGLPPVDPEQVAQAQRRMLLRSLVELKLTADRVRRGQDEIDETALRLRAAGASWGNLGLALGITRQAAQQRYSAGSR